MKSHTLASERAAAAAAAWAPPKAGKAAESQKAAESPKAAESQKAAGSTDAAPNRARLAALLVASALTALPMLSACGSAAAGGGGQGGGAAGGSVDFDLGKEITVVSREDGSGTRGAFIELFGIEETTDEGKKDRTTKEAIIAKQTDIMMNSVVGNKYAVGYSSLGSLNDMVRAVDIDGVEPSTETVKDGSYAIARPFILATKGAPPPEAADFISFILSSEGQDVIAANYIPVDEAAPSYAPTVSAGKVTVEGSSSVTPVMEKLKEAYVAINPGMDVEVQQNDSSTGLKAAISGISDIAMSSRELKESELAELTPTQIALDGVVVIVNTENSVQGLSKEQVKAIFTGEAAKWGDVFQ
ncbi:MAG: substrate-binding domain-containing protein [Clostridiales bacterium]|jgi:phosphate transport system substrate-binding protein|nr:substrate-binding domain-containing protein [Clostridiales bacterium]